MDVLLFGATGAVGHQVLKQALANPAISRVTAPTRRALPVHDKLTNPVVDFSHPLPDADWWHADAMICCLGTTQGKAGSKSAFRAVDHDLVLATAEKARQHGTPALVLNSSLGANHRSRSFYLRTKGELEQALQQLGFDRLVLVRPSLIDTDREERRLGEQAGLVASRLMAPLIPARYRAVPAEAIARTLLHAAEASGALEVIESDQIR